MVVMSGRFSGMPQWLRAGAARDWRAAIIEAIRPVRPEGSEGH